jgi:predicted acylesterase/phospholipase RssA
MSKQHNKPSAFASMRMAQNFSEWQAACSTWELESGITEWRTGTDSDYKFDHINYPYNAIRTHQDQLESALEANDCSALVNSLTESLYRLLNELNDPELHAISSLGSKTFTQYYLATVFKCLDYLSHTPTIDRHTKLSLFKAAQHNLGAPALMLSGGGTFGIYHLGVIKALHEQDLVPDIISGSSMGSIAAGILATHNDEELEQFFLNPHLRDYAPLKRLSLKQITKQSCLLDDQRLYDCIYSNVGDMTFAEAFKHSGRTVSITVSPTRPNQKPRLLNHLTSPNVLVAHAAKASCSIPGLFPAVQLQQRVQGKVMPYCQDERWVDGSFATDIPRQRLSRLFNVNFFIVSQANPHILPFVKNKHEPGWFSALKDISISSLHAQSRVLLSVMRRRSKRPMLRSFLDQLRSMVNQDYQGDINIHPELPFNWYSKFMINPTAPELDFLVLAGEKATWPKLAQINEQTQLYQKLSEIITKLESSQPKKALAS